MAAKTGSSKDLVVLVQAAVTDGRTIRANAQVDSYSLALSLTAELQDCAMQYAGCPNTDTSVFDEAVEFVVAQFGYLSLGEIRHAFRLAAANELDGVGLETYYGLFTVGMLGKLLAGYKSYRDRITSEVLKAEKEAGFAQAQVVKSEQWDSGKWAARRLEVLQGIEDHGQATAYDYDFFTSAGTIEVTQEQKEQAWKDAFFVAQAEVQDSVLRGDWSMKRVLDKIVAGQKDDGFSAKRMVIAKQLLVFRWVESKRNQQLVHQ